MYKVFESKIFLIFLNFLTSTLRKNNTIIFSMVLNGAGGIWLRRVSDRFPAFAPGLYYGIHSLWLDLKPLVNVQIIPPHICKSI